MGKEKSTRHKPMTKEVLIKWRQRMGYEHRECAHELGCTVREWRAWENGEVPIPRYIGLACAALALGMSSYGENGA